MIVTKTPLRISFVGGGSDRPGFYSEEPGACVAAAIDKYVYVALNDKYDGSIRAAYSVTENVSSIDQLQHELIRGALRLTGIRGVEMHSIADIPGGSGLGSSSAFTVGLLHALLGYKHTASLARDACTVELDMCRKPIGKQDQYTAAYGGLNLLGFTSKGVSVAPIACDRDALSSHCLLLDTGMSRQGDAGAVLAAQQQDRDDVRALAGLAVDFAKALADGDIVQCAVLMDNGWQVKRRFLNDPRIEDMYCAANRAGAWGGKLCGAGGGGFLLFLAPPDKHQAIINALGLRHVPIRVGVPGCAVVYQS